MIGTKTFHDIPHLHDNISASDYCSSSVNYISKIVFIPKALTISWHCQGGSLSSCIAFMDEDLANVLWHLGYVLSQKDPSIFNVPQNR